MERQTGVRQSFLNSAPLLVALFSILVPAMAQAQIFTTLRNFGALTDITGFHPRSQLAQGPDGTLYGTAAEELLHDDVRTTMPPSPTWIAGIEANTAFYRPMFDPSRRGEIRALRTSANGQPAFAFYGATSPGEPRRRRAIHVIEVRERAIASIDHFMLPELFPVFGLPDELPR